MKLLDRFAYVQELRAQLVRKDLELIDLKADVKRLVDALCTTKQVMAPFGALSTATQNFGTVRRVSVAREIQDMEAKYDTGKDAWGEKDES